jgi:putative cell wall-binding protein
MRQSTTRTPHRRQPLRRLVTGLSVVLLTTSFLIDTATAAYPAPTDIRRIAGATRYETAAQLSNSRFPYGSEQVYLATGANFADALSAGPLANQNVAPLLLTSSLSIPQRVRLEIELLQPSEVIILGGPSAVSPAVEDQIRQLGVGQVRRIAGADRFDTAVQVSKAAHPGSVSTIFLATGSNFADALAAGPVASAEGSPILLTGRDSIPNSVWDEIARLRPEKIVILGGPNAISTSVESSLRGSFTATVERISGSNRYETNLELVRRYFNDPVFNIHLVTGENFADALAAAAYSWPILMSTRDCLPDATLQEVLQLGVMGVTVLGGEGAVSQRAGSLVSCSGSNPGGDTPSTTDVRELLDLFHPAFKYVGEDKTAVVLCRVPADSTDPNYQRDRTRIEIDPREVAAFANREVTKYFKHISRNRYWPTFEYLTTIDLETNDGSDECRRKAVSLTSGSFTNTLAIDNSRRFDGKGGTGRVSSTSIHLTEPPSRTGRGYWVGGWGAEDLFLQAHELGHTLSWDHSHISPGNDYDNPLDLMSNGTGCSPFVIPDGTCSPHNTLAFNRFVAGWIDPEEVNVHRDGRSSTVLSRSNTSGQQMLVAMHPWRPELFLTFEARVRGEYGQGLPVEGVVVHFVNQSTENCWSGGVGICQVLWRRQGQALGASESFDHLLAPGSPSVTVEGLTITISNDSSGFRVDLEGTYMG